MCACVCACVCVCVCVRVCVCVGYSHVMQYTPATVGVSRAQTLAAGGVLSAVLHWNPGQLQENGHSSLVVHAFQDVMIGA